MRCQSRLDECPAAGAERSRAQLHVRIAALGGCTLRTAHQHSRRATAHARAAQLGQGCRRALAERVRTFQVTASANGRGATRRDYTVWTVRCQSRLDECPCSRRGAEPRAAAREDRRSRRRKVLNAHQHSQQVHCLSSRHGFARGDCTVWTVRCQSRANDCTCSRREAALLHVRIAAVGGCTL
jgi:hypothetical protein